MIRKQAFGLVLAGAATMLAFSGQANAEAYAFTLLGTLGGTISTAKDINNAGQVIGSSWTTGNSGSFATLWSDTTTSSPSPSILAGSSSVVNAINSSGQIAGNTVVHFDSWNWGWRASVWNGSELTTLGVLPGTVHSDAWAINSSGQIAGRSIIDPFNGSYHATVWTGTVPTDLGADSGAYAINDSGQVAGSREFGNQFVGYGLRATLWNGTVATDLGTLGGTRSAARAINNLGVVAGYSSLAGDLTYHATLWDGIVSTDLGTLGGANSFANDINNMGSVVGYSDGMATLWNGQDAVNLNSFLDASAVNDGWVLVSANSINDLGQIVGEAANTKTGISQVFMLTVTAVPEPESYVMLLTGLAILGGFSRVRRKSV